MAKLTKQFKLQVKTKQGWQDAYYDYPHAKRPMSFDKKEEAITARMKKFGIGSKHFTRVVTPKGRKFIL
ncbi:hypothetical protein LCGC14_0363040 [marine sediment metagenome]|uniref:Uncharacterized protein n=1 Tax=marine sediment metagenome TaxID=412755 RepID=A0A0F9WFM5_9ZZZZ